MWRQRLVFVVLFMLVVSTLAQVVGPNEPTKKVGFGELLTMVEQGKVSRAEVNGRDHTLTAWTAQGDKHETGYPQDYGAELVKTLRTHDVAFTVDGTGRSALLSVLTYALPFLIFIGLWVFLLLIGFWIFLMNQMQGGGS